MADDILKDIPLPADLPENWTSGQIIAPTGAEAGLDNQHGYNYLMKQVNNAQKALKALAAQREEDLARIKFWVNPDPTSPASFIGGTWERIKDRFILAAGDTYAAGSTGGESTHTHDYALIYNALYGVIIGTDENLIRSFDYATSTHKTSQPIAYISGVKKNKGIVDEYEDTDNTALMRNDAKTNTASTIPPYTAMYVWKRIA